MTRNRAQGRGFTVTEMLITLGLLSTFAVVATHLFTGTFKLFGQNTRSIETSIRFDAAINAMRDDVESSTSIELRAADVLVVHSRGGNEIRWKADGKQLSRADSGETRGWETGQRLQFLGEGALLLIHSAESNSSTTDIALAPGGEVIERLK